MMTNYLAITISRQSGSGGREIGKILAERLGIACYDREIIERASKESGISENFFSSKAWDDELVTTKTQGKTEEFRRIMTRQRVFAAQSDAIRRIISERPCVFVGRAADYVLEGHKNRFSVFLSADLSDRVKRVSKKYQLTEREAEVAIRKVDRQRSLYYDYFTEMQWGASDHYDCCLCTSCFGLEKTADAIEQLIKTLSLTVE